MVCLWLDAEQTLSTLANPNKSVPLRCYSVPLCQMVPGYLWEEGEKKIRKTHIIFHLTAFRYILPA
jgi:hypothetical protein